MRQAVIAFSLFGSFALYAATVDLFETAVLFLLFGILPGRSEPIPAGEMLAVYAWAALLVIGVAFRTSFSTLVASLRARGLGTS